MNGAVQDLCECGCGSRASWRWCSPPNLYANEGGSWLLFGTLPDAA
jgi:hypothetical protein